MSLVPRPAHNNGDIEETAAEWLTLRDAGLTTEQAARFHTWLEADPRHRIAIEELDRVWAALNRPRVEGRSVQVAEKIARRVGRRPVQVKQAVAIGLAIAAAVALMVWLPFESRRSPQAVQTATSIVPRPDRHDLPDGSAIELNFGAQIDVAYSEEMRKVRLVRGEALFIVAKDAARPFIVQVDEINVRAVGTAFTVQRDVARLGVLVTEGHVAVETLRGNGSPEVSTALTAGRRIEIPLGERRIAAAQIVPVSQQEISAALEWRQRRLEFTATPLAEALERFNAVNELQLVAANEETAQLRITGVAWTHDPQGFVHLLERSLGLHIKRDGAARIILEK